MGFYAVLENFFREPDASLIAGMSRGQFYSLFMIVTGLLIIAYAHKSKKISS